MGFEQYHEPASELSQETQLKIKRGKVIEELLKQEPLISISWDVQILMLSLVFTGFFDGQDIDFVKAKKRIILETLRDKTYKSLLDSLKTIKLDELIGQLRDLTRPLADACGSGKDHRVRQPVLFN